MQDENYASDIQNLFQQLSKSVAGTAWNLRQKTVTASKGSGHAALPTWLRAEHIAVSEKPLTKENLDRGLYSLVPLSANVPVHMLKGTGKKLTSGVLQLAPSSCIVLGPDCHDVAFEDIEIKGAQLLGYSVV